MDINVKQSGLWRIPANNPGVLLQLLDQPLTKGNLLVATISGGSASVQAVPALSDSLGNKWTRIGSAMSGINSGPTSLFWAMADFDGANTLMAFSNGAQLAFWEISIPGITPTDVPKFVDSLSSIASVLQQISKAQIFDAKRS